MKVSILLFATILLSAGGTALAVGSGKTIEFKGGEEGTVLFDGSAHKKAGLTCSDCHNPALFPAMKQGTVKITMSDLYAGKYCGRCHDGKKAFMIKDNCTRCHHKKGTK